MLDKQFLQNDTTKLSQDLKTRLVRPNLPWQFSRAWKRQTTAVKLVLFSVYRGKMESERSEYWLSDRLVLNIAPGSVLLQTVAV